MNAETLDCVLGEGMALTLQLQWGRVLMNAETPTIWLNRRPAEEKSEASMGPRSHERGNKAHYLDSRGHHQADACFNGAAFS